MTGNPQDILAILAGAALIFGAGGNAVRARIAKPHPHPSEPTPETAPAAQSPDVEKPPG